MSQLLDDVNEVFTVGDQAPSGKLQPVIRTHIVWTYSFKRAASLLLIAERGERDRCQELIPPTPAPRPRVPGPAQGRASCRRRRL